MSNRQLEERQEEFADKQLASFLGISLDDLYELEWNIDTDESKDGLIYHYIVEFHENSPKKILDKIEGLENGGPIFIPSHIFEPYEDYYEHELAWEINSTEQLKIFRSHLASVNNLVVLDTDENTQFNLLVMLHAHIVSATESFISSTFISEVTNSEKLLQKLVESDPELGKRKFTLKEIYQTHENLKIIIASYLKGLIFHRLDKIKPMYKMVMGIDFGDISWLFEAVKIRHDCVHRAGYDKEGEKVSITKDSILKLSNKCDNFCENIARRIISKRMEI